MVPGTGIGGTGGTRGSSGATIEDQIFLEPAPATDLNLSATFTYTFSFSWVPDNSTDYPPKSVNTKVIDDCYIIADSGGELITGVPAPFEVSLSCGLKPADCSSYVVTLDSYPYSDGTTRYVDQQAATEYLTLSTNIPLGLGSDPPTTDGTLSYSVAIDGEVTGATFYMAYFDVQFYFE
jgi:hypothetical protein